jgi:hypothetical protein
VEVRYRDDALEFHWLDRLRVARGNGRQLVSDDLIAFKFA